jgi:hypothetical protein
VDFPSLRHTFGTALARAGVAPKVAMDLMRHSDINLTMRLYSHTVVADWAKALEKLPRIKQQEQPAAVTRTDGVERNRASVFPHCFPRFERFRSIDEDSGGLKRPMREKRKPFCSKRKQRFPRPKRESHRWDSNPRPAVYKTAALPIELRWRTTQV